MTPAANCPRKTKATINPDAPKSQVNKLPLRPGKGLLPQLLILHIFLTELSWVDFTDWDSDFWGVELVSVVNFPSSLFMVT
jgi:hypothetical protein